MKKSMGKSILGGSFLMGKTGRINNKYTVEFKVKVVEDYLSGKCGGLRQLVKKYELKSNAQIRRLSMIYNEDPSSLGIDMRGKKATGRPKGIRLDDMSLEEQNHYLRMENDILKKLNALLRDYEER